jgi:two-component sensor histidine kinase
MSRAPAATLTEPRERAPRRPRLLPSPRQLAAAVLVAFVAAVALIPSTHNTFIELVGETLFVAIMLLIAFTLAGAWRQDWLPRWVVQVAAVVLAALLSPLLVQLLTFGGDFTAFIGSRPHVRGYVLVSIGAGILGVLFALGGLYRERDAQARAQALQFALERETLERQAADARLHLLTAQIQPHFLLNTLANVQELVESGSPRAAPVFRSLIDYLRAAVPHLQQEGATLADEVKLVRAYLDLMHMRMPDRLSFSTVIEPALLGMRFPPMALLTLVENAIRHGIDPSLTGGAIEVGGRRIDAQTVQLWVADTGAGLSESAGAGTGLANLNARLHAFFGDSAGVQLSEQAPSGLRAEIQLRVPA